MFKKTFNFACIVASHCLAKLIKIYGDLVTRIKEVQLEFSAYRVKGLRDSLAFQMCDVEAAYRKAKGEHIVSDASMARKYERTLVAKNLKYRRIEVALEAGTAEATP